MSNHTLRTSPRCSTPIRLISYTVQRESSIPYYLSRLVPLKGSFGSSTPHYYQDTMKPQVQPIESEIIFVGFSLTKIILRLSQNISLNKSKLWIHQHPNLKFCFSSSKNQVQHLKKGCLEQIYTRLNYEGTEQDSTYKCKDKMCTQRLKLLHTIIKDFKFKLNQIN